MALGVSVASATNPTFQFGTEGVNSSNSIQSPTDITVGNVTWVDDSNLLKPTTSGSTAIETIDIVFSKDTSNGSSNVSGSTLTITGGGQIEANRLPVIQLTSSKGLKLNDGSGKIKVDFNSAKWATGDVVGLSRRFVLDLSGVSSGDLALQGNIEIGTGSATWSYGENQFIAKFGGTGMQGNITIEPTGDQDGLATQFIFLNGANLNGNLVLKDNDNSNQNNTFVFGSGDITGEITSQACGSTTIIYGTSNKTIASTLDLMAGTFTYQFASSVSNNKIFTLDTSKTNISGGHIVFDGVSKVILKNGNTNGGTLTIAPKTTNNSTYKNGSVTFKLDSSAQASSSSPIVDGNLSITNGNLTFVLKDTKNITGSNPFTNDNATPPTKTYYVNGNISITNGGFSAFWDDSIGFYGKISSTQFSATWGLIGNTNAWFSGAQSFSTIQATTAGTSHIVFDERITITGAVSGQTRIGISSTSDNSTQILFKKGTDITGNITQERTGYNEITLDDTSSISGDILAQDNVEGRGGTNTITFKKGGSITGDITASDLGNYGAEHNIVANTITFNGTQNASINGNIHSGEGGNVEGKGNVIAFNGTGTNSIVGDISAGVTAWGGAGRNKITFANNSTSSIEGDISTTLGGVNIITFSGANGSITGDIEAGGNNHGSGGNTITFNNGGSITGDISTKIVNVTVVSSKGQNNNTITFGGTADATITGNLFSTDGAIGNKGNIINFNGNGINKIIGNLVASADGGFVSNGKNTITFGTSTHTALIDGSITAQNDEKYWDANGGINQINTNSSLTVTGNISVIRKGENNFDLKADGITLTLQGADNTISTLTALDGATNGNTLVLDGSNNSVNTTIATLANGEKLIVGFSEGNSTKTLAITASNKATTTQIDLKGIVIDGTSENNTLDLSTATQSTITDKITVADNQALKIKLGANSNLTLTGGLDTTGTSEINVVGASNIATSTLSGGNITASKLNITSASTSSTLTFNSTTANFATFATNSAANDITLGATAQTVTFGTTQNAATAGNPVVFRSVTFSGTNNQTLAINGGTNTISTLALGSNVNTLAIGGGETTIANSITLGAGKDFTLKLSSNSDKANLSSTDVVVNHALVANGGSAKVLFTGGTDNQRYLSTLTLNSTGNSLTSVTSQAKNAKILMNGASDANLGTLSIAQNASLLIGFEGTGTSSVTLGNGSSNVVIGDKQTFGISIGGSGTKNVSVTANGGHNIVFGGGSTLIVDFQKTTSTDNITATLGKGTGFVIAGGSNSIINLRGGDGNSELSGGVTVDGGNNTVNFLDDATFSNVTLVSGSNTINVYDGTVSDSVEGIVAVDDIDSVTNTINLGDYATLKLETSGQGELISSGLNNELNFKGNNAKLDGGFGATGNGTAIIKVGSTNAKISGNVCNASLLFEISNSDLTLQGSSNTLTNLSATSSGILILDGANNANNGVIASVANAIEKNNSNNATVTFNFNGTTSKKAELTLEGSGNFVKAISLESGSTNNKIIFNSGDTDIDSAINIDGIQALALDLGNTVNLTLAGNLFNAGNAEVNFTGASGTLVSDITTNGAGAITTIKAGNASIGKIVGTIETTTGETNVEFDNGGILKLQGNSNALTSISATTAGTLSLDGANNANNGVIASVANQISGNNITLNLNGATGKKAELTLSAAGNAIKAISLGDGNGSATVANKLVLSAGATNINDAVSVVDGQALALDLKNGVNLTLAGSLNNAGKTEINFAKGTGTLVGDIITNTASATTAINVGDIIGGMGTTGVITGSIKGSGITNLVYAGVSGTDAFTLQGNINQITSVDATHTGEFILDTTKNAVTTTIDKTIIGDNLKIQFGGNASQDRIAKLILNNASNSRTPLAESKIHTLTLNSNSAKNGVAYNTLELTSGSTTITNPLSAISSDQGINFDFSGVGTTRLELAMGLTNSGGVASINFNQGNGVFDGGLGVSNGITTINVLNGANGTITSTISGSGTAKVVFKTSQIYTSDTPQIPSIASLTLQGERNEFSNVDAITSGVLKLSGMPKLNSEKNAVNVSINTLTNGNNLDIVFATDKDNLLAIENVDSGANGALILKSINTTSGSGTLEIGGKITSFALAQTTDILTVAKGKTLNITALGGNGGTILTLKNAINATGAKSLLSIGKMSSTNVVAEQALNNINVALLGNNSSLKLQGDNNTLASINSSSGMLILDGANNANDGVIASVANQISGNNITLNLNGATGKKAELTLSAAGNAIKAISLGDGNGSATVANKLVLSASATNINDAVSIVDGQALALDLGNTVNLTLAGNLNNAGSAEVNFTGASGTLVSDIITNGAGAITTIKAGNASIGKIVGAIETATGETNVEFDNGGILKLQGNSNALTSISATTAGTLSLDGANNIGNGVIASVANQISGNNITLNLNGATGKKAELTLSAGGNAIKAISLGDGSGKITQANKLILKTGATSVENAVSIGDRQELIFDLQGDSTLNLYSITNQSSSQPSALTFNINGGSSDTNTISGDISTSVQVQGGLAETSFNLADGSNAITTGSISTQGETGAVSTNIIFDGTSGFTLQGATNQITSVSTKESTGNGRLTLNAINNSVEASIAGQIAGNNITLGFNGATGKKAELTLSAAGNAIKAISLGDGNGSATVANKLVLSAGGTNINDAVSVANKQDLAFDLKNGVNLTLVGNLNNAGNTEVNFTGISGTLTSDINTSGNGNTIFNLGLSDGSLTTVTATITGDITNTTNATSTFNIYATTVNFNGKNGLAFTDGTNEIVFGKEGAILNWKNTDGSAIQAISTTGGNTNISFNTSGTIAGDINTTGGVTTINVGNDTIRSVEPVKITQGIIDGTISTTGGATNVAFKGNDAVLILKDDATLTSVSNSIISQSRVKDASTPSTPTILYGSNNGISFYHNERNGNDDFKTLTIGTLGEKDEGISGDGLNFLVYAKSNKEVSNTQPSSRSQVAQAPVYADKVVILSSSNVDETNNTRESTHHLGVKFEDGTDLKSISYKKDGDNNILIATVANSSGVSFEKTEETVLGFNIADVDYTAETVDENGVITENGSYTNYYVGRIQNIDIIQAEQKVVATAFSFNYDLYMANLNSLNKRMGELRDNPHSHGVWARVFNGAQTNKQGLETKSNYTTIQAGYDYAFGFEGANNYLGFALSYALSLSTSDKAFDTQGNTVGFGDIYSNAVEVAVYNSYVMDSGWYNDTIAKFSYLMSNFSINDAITQQSANNDTQNFAFTLGDEVGYKFALGDNKEWGITPQVELTFGYFNQSDLKRTLENSISYLDSVADAVLTLRARAGSSFSYDFKNFTQDKGFNASLYVGAFYEYDYVKGGNISMTTEQQITHNNQFSDIGSDGRVVVNVGTNMSIQESTRLYFDFEKSFVGDLTTDYQVNFGVRYSFGESNGYTPMVENTGFKAPLKAEDEGKTGEKVEDGEKTEEKIDKIKDSKEIQDKKDGEDIQKKSTNSEVKDTEKKELAKTEEDTKSKDDKKQKSDEKKTKSKKTKAEEKAK